MNAPAAELDLTPVLSLRIESERDIVTARQRARQISAMVGFGDQDQVRIATAVSEIARNAHQYAGNGKVDFVINLRSRPQSLWIQVSDHGPGIADLDAVLSGRYVSPSGMGIGVIGTSRLMDQFQIESSREHGTTVLFAKRLPPSLKPLGLADVGRVGGSLATQISLAVDQELLQQNRELLQTLYRLRSRELELERRHQDFARLNLELEETNRGVVALYAELEEKAIALRLADEMKSRILHHVSHEFRTPVSSILALTRILLDRMDGDLSTEQEKQLHYIRDAAQQLSAIVNDFLDLAKVESGTTEVHSAVIDVSKFLGSTRALMRPLATRETVNLVFEEPDAGLKIYTDESKLGQIVRNLISNALKFTQQGEVRVAALVSPAGDEICFTVKDTGIGIAPEDQDRIFQEFAQIRSSIQRQVKGTGLGLPLSRRLAGLLGGTLVVESAVGSGTTFKLSLPMESMPSESRTGDAPEATGGTILIVDDDPAARYLVTQLLRGTHHRIIDSTASEAAERARFELPALILVDLVMPDRSGFGVLEDLQLHERTRDIPVIIHTSKTLTKTDMERLAGRHLSILPKGEGNRLPALSAIRAVLNEPALFGSEPEFRDNSDSGG